MKKLLFAAALALLASSANATEVCEGTIEPVTDRSLLLRMGPGLLRLGKCYFFWNAVPGTPGHVIYESCGGFGKRCGVIGTTKVPTKTDRGVPVIVSVEELW